MGKQETKTTLFGHKINALIVTEPRLRELNTREIDKLQPWLYVYENSDIKKPEDWPKDYWGFPFPVDTHVYGKTGRITPRDPGTILMYSSLQGMGWPLYVGDVVEIEMRDSSQFGVVSPVTGEIIKEKRLASWRRSKPTDPDVYDMIDMYESFQKGTKVNGTIVARWCYGDEYGERYHVLIGEKIYRLENEIPAGTAMRRCPFMFKLLIGSDLGNEERRKRGCFLKSVAETSSTKEEEGK